MDNWGGNTWSATGLPAENGENAPMPHPEFDTVALVSVEENQDAFVVALADAARGDGAYLVFQCSLTPPGASDIATGPDSYCLLDEAGAVQYGGVTRAALDGDRLTLALTDEAAETLGVEDGTNTITLNIPPEDTGRLVEGLRRIFTYGNPAKLPQLAGI